MANKNDILYKDVFKNPRVHSNNQAYWNKILSKYTAGMYENDWDKLFPMRKDAYDDCYAPILMFYNERLGRGIRIIQYSPDVYESKYRYEQFLTAWISTFELENREVPELVIYLLLTPDNSLKAEDLIRLWINHQVDELKEKIQQIYNNQK